VSDDQEPEEPRGDEPYWFEELRRDAAYEEWMKPTIGSEEITMPLNVRNTAAKTFKKVPQGIHAAVCNMVVDCGIQPGGKFKPRHQVYVRWEIPSERVEWTDRHGTSHEGPMNIGKFYTASLAEKAALRRDLENWRGRAFTHEELAGFDLFKILGTACQIMVTHSAQGGGDSYANVTGVMGFPRDLAKPKAEHRLVKYSPEEPGQFDDLPQWLRDKVASSLTAPLEGSIAFASDDEMQDELPFARAR
jgi:hypothetical protein